MRVLHNRCSLCNRKSNRLTDGIIMADLKVIMCPSCFNTIKSHVEIRGKLLHDTLPEYRVMIQKKAQAEAQQEAYKKFLVAREDVRRVLGA